MSGDAGRGRKTQRTGHSRDSESSENTSGDDLAVLSAGNVSASRSSRGGSTAGRRRRVHRTGGGSSRGGGSLRARRVTAVINSSQLTGDEEQLLQWDRALAASTSRDNLGLHGRRPPTWLPGVQGAHVTAYGLIRRALSNAFSSINEQGNAYSEGWFKQGRDRVFRFVDQLLYLGPDDSAEKQEIQRMMISLIRRYDVTRSRNTGLKMEFKSSALHSNPATSRQEGINKMLAVWRHFRKNIGSGAGGSAVSSREKELKLLVRTFSNRLIVGDKAKLERELLAEFRGIDSRISISEQGAAMYDIIQRAGLGDESIRSRVFSEHRVKNARLIEEMCRHITIHALRYYNKLDNVAFFHTEESRARRPGKMYEGPALDSLDKGVADLSPSDLIRAIDGLLDYKKLTNPAQDGRGHRVNDIGLLVDLAARHLFLFFSAYPQAAKKYGVDIFNFKKAGSAELLSQVITPFLQKFLKEDWSRVIPQKTKLKNKATAVEVIQAIRDKFIEMVSGSVARPGIKVRSGVRPSSESDDSAEEGTDDSSAAAAAASRGAAPVDPEKDREQEMVSQAIAFLSKSTAVQLRETNAGLRSENASLKGQVAKMQQELGRLTQLLSQKSMPTRASDVSMFNPDSVRGRGAATSPSDQPGHRVVRVTPGSRT